MSFLTAEFIFFFALVIGSYYFIPVRFRWIQLLAASLVFYGLISLPYLMLVMVLTLIDYGAARGMALESFRNRRKILLAAGLGSNLLVLIFFKYSRFIIEFIQDTFGNSSPQVPGSAEKLLIPLGISYYIFRKLSYLMDVYREKISPERCYFRLLLYVLFFPEVIAGPIDRAGHLIPQFSGDRGFDVLKIRLGFQFILWGLFKKLVIADRLALLVSPVFNQPAHFSSGQLLLAVLGFSIQIYCDFSGYTDMALGIGHTLGYSLADNFDRPYFSRSVVEFWKRWHISLSKWLQDYLFLPLAYLASRKLKKNAYLSIKSDLLAYGFGALLTMSLCGLWHGISLNFIFWGFLHGLLLTLSFVFRRTRKKIRKFLNLKHFPRLDRLFRTALTFFLVSSTWIFFRPVSLGRGFEIAGRIFLGKGPADPGKLKSLAAGGFSMPDGIIAISAVLLLLATEIIPPGKTLGTRILAWPRWRRWLTIYGLIFIILIFGVFKSDIFIYEGF